MTKDAKVINIPIAKLVKDYTLYPRTDVSSTTIAQYTEAMRAGAIFPPIHADRQSYRIIDGWHRLEAYKRIGAEEVPVVLEDTKDDAELYMKAVVANSEHGRSFSPYDYSRILLRADELGLQRELISGVLHITGRRVEEITHGFASLLDTDGAGGHKVALKRPFRNFAGKEMTQAQWEAQRKISVPSQLYAVNQVLIILEAN